MITLLLLKPAFVVGVAALIAACCRHRTAATRHAIWAAAVVTTLSIPILSVAIPPIRISAPPPVTVVSELVTSGTTRRAAPQPVAVPVWLDRDALRPWLPQALFDLWLTGAILFSARRVAAEIALRRIVRRSRAARLRGIATRPEIRLSDEISSPAVAGAFRPVVLLPTAAEQWTNTDLEAVLIHELGHVARGDCLLNLCGDLAKAIFWFNPAVHVAVRRMRAESEIACDDRVLLGGAEPERYAHLLLAIARRGREHGRLPGGVTAMARPRELEFRLLSVLDTRVPRTSLTRTMSVTFAGVGMLLALPTAALTLQAFPVDTAALMALEPDRRGDSVASPLSERVPFSPDPNRLAAAAAQALAGPDSVLARSLATALAHRPEHDGDLVAERAAWALSQMQNGRLVEPLLSALDASDWRVQAYAAWALAIAHDSRTVARLIPLLSHPVWRLRAMAALALRHSLDPRAEAAMIGALSDPAWQVRVEAVQYVGAIRGPLSNARLTARLADRHIAVRLAAEHALTSH